MHVFIAGAGGQLGKHLIHLFLQKDFHVTAMGYSRQEFAGLTHPRLTLAICDVTRPEQLKGVCKGADAVVSCLGITRMRGNLSHYDVDYLGNLNLLREAEQQGVRTFGFITPVGAGHGHEHGVPLLQAKHLFKQELRKSGLNWVIFRAGGFFSDLADVGRMAAKGTMYVVGPGTQIFTPVHVGDVAQVMADELLVRRNAVVEIGGPEDMSWNEICRACFAHYGKAPHIVHVPIWLCRLVLLLLKPFSPAYEAMGKLIVFMSTHDLPTARRGRLRFADYLHMQEGCRA